MKTFELQRDEDETGVSGTGVIRTPSLQKAPGTPLAEGCVFSDGWCAMRRATPAPKVRLRGPRWVNEPRTTTLFPSLGVVLHIHGHGGKTRIVWTGESMCRLPPAGWECSRSAPHEGPCAAMPTRAG